MIATPAYGTANTGHEMPFSDVFVCCRVRIGELARLHSKQEFKARVMLSLLLAQSQAPGFCESRSYSQAGELITDDPKSAAPSPTVEAAEAEGQVQEIELSWFLTELLKCLHTKYLEEGFGQILF